MTSDVLETGQRPICILGMHRSGTSCLAGSLQLAGIHLGDVVTEAAYNQKGNRENLAIRALNDDVLEYSGGNWQAPPETIRWTPAHEARRDALIHSFGKSSRRWGFKDPRTLMTLAFWKVANVQFQFVGTYRHPLAVARSLIQRSPSMTLDRALGIWLEYNARLLEVLEREKCPLVNFDQGEDEYLCQLGELFEQLDLPVESLAAPGRFFDRVLRHQSITAVGEDEPVPEELVHVFGTLERYWRRRQ